MKVIIAGSRTIEKMDLVERAISLCKFNIEEVVCGNCRGVDTLGKIWAENKGVKVTVFKPDWNKHGKSAGPKRNAQMAEYADALIAIWNGSSPGTRDMIKRMEKLNKPVYVLSYY